MTDISTFPICTQCHRHMRPRSSRPEDFPGVPLIGSKGLCATHYTERWKRNNGWERPPGVSSMESIQKLAAARNAASAARTARAEAKQADIEARYAAHWRSLLPDLDSPEGLAVVASVRSRHDLETTRELLEILGLLPWVRPTIVVPSTYI